MILVFRNSKRWPITAKRLNRQAVYAVTAKTVGSKGKVRSCERRCVVRSSLSQALALSSTGEEAVMPQARGHGAPANHGDTMTKTTARSRAEMRKLDDMPSQLAALETMNVPALAERLIVSGNVSDLYARSRYVSVPSMNVTRRTDESLCIAT